MTTNTQTSTSALRGHISTSAKLHRSLVSRLSLVAVLLGMAIFGPNRAAASPGSESDAATIKASSDPIYQVRVIQLYDPEGKMGEVKVSVENTLRGDDSMTGKYLNLVWDTDYPTKNQNWVVMVTQGDDGALHVHPEIRYDVSEESISEEGKSSWIQMKVLAADSE